MLRAGAGVFFARIEPELTLDVLRSATAGLEQVVVEHPEFFPNLPGWEGFGRVLPTAHSNRQWRRND